MVSCILVRVDKCFGYDHIESVWVTSCYFLLLSVSVFLCSLFLGWFLFVFYWWGFGFWVASGVSVCVWCCGLAPALCSMFGAVWLIKLLKGCSKKKKMGLLLYFISI